MDPQQKTDSRGSRGPLVNVARFIGVVAVIVIALVATLVVLGVLPPTILQEAALKIGAVTLIVGAAIAIVTLLIGRERR